MVRWASAAVVAVAALVVGRGLGEDTLCGSGHASQGFAATCGEQVFKPPSSWASCCSFEHDVKSGVCRTFELSGKYCDPETDQNGCAQLGQQDKLVLDLSFDALPAGAPCCKSCVCFGDPECVAFDGSKDLWIPCDGRTLNSCTVTRAACEKLQDPSWTASNPQMCQWIRKDRDDNKGGWDMAMNGSPCVPDLTKDILMNMHKGSGGFNADLVLGERGIIQEIRFTIDGKKHSLDALDCFQKAPNESWQENGPPAGSNWTKSDDNKEVAWSFFDSKSQTYVKMLCVRAVSGTRNGLPRINVQEITVSKNSKGSGFCTSGNIAGRTGDYEDSAIKHGKCIQDVPDPLQACKHLVNFALTERDLQECARQYCAIADIPKGNCDLGNGESGAKWIRVYCQAIRNNGQLPPEITDESCRSQVDEQGFAFATETWGKGLKLVDLSGNQTCGVSLNEYTIAKKPSCTNGVSIDVFVGSSAEGTWQELFFIPASHAPCKGQLVLTYSELSPDGKKLFTHPLRLRQCGIKQQVVCEQVATCSENVGIRFSITFTNQFSALVEAYENGFLRCKKDSSGNDMWCLPGEDYEPVDLCPCPPEERLLRAN